VMSDRIAGTKEHILICAKELFIRNGYGATTVSDVLQASGVAKGTFYHHFSSKENLLSEVADRIKGKYMRILDSISADDRLRADEKFAYIEKSIMDVEETQWVHRELHDGDVAPALLVNVLRQSFEEALPKYLIIMDQGRKDGTIVTPYPGTASILLLLLNIISLHMGDDSLESLSHFRKALLHYTDDTIQKDD